MIARMRWSGSRTSKIPRDHERLLGAYEETPQATFFIDPVRLAKVALRGNLTAGLAITSLEPLGLDGIEGIGGTMLFATEQYDSLFQFHFLIGQPRKGLLNLLALRGGDTTPEAFVPKEAASYMTIDWDIQQTFREFKALYETFQGPDSLNPPIKAFENATGLVFEDDVLNAPTGRLTLLTSFAKPIRLNSQSSVIAVHVRDGKKTREALEKVVERFNDRFDLQTHAGKSYYKVPMNERARRTLEENPLIRIPEPCLTVLGDVLIYCDSEEVLKEVFAANGNVDRQLASRPDFQVIADTVSKEAGGSKIGMFSYARPDETFRNMYEFINSPDTRRMLEENAQQNRFVRTIQEALEANELPPFEVLAKYMAPSGAMMIDAETGYHYMAFGLRSDE